MEKIFYSNGKLLLSAEYVVLDGAVALALPTKFGQTLVVEKGYEKKIDWKSYDYDGSIWFEDAISFTEIQNPKVIIHESVRSTLVGILHQAFLMDPIFIDDYEGYTITTKLSFPRNWGLGTSSTLINNIAQWLKIDAFVLLKNSFGGSGYDIACAQSDGPILFQLKNGKPAILSVAFQPKFAAHLFFVYLNQKQSSKEAIASYQKKQHNLDELIPAINQITASLITAHDKTSFAKEIEKHEMLMAAILGTESIKEKLFSDFNGTLKSLGAWGGDFLLAISEEDPTDYFTKKGYATIIPYHDMIG